MVGFTKGRSKAVVLVLFFLCVGTFHVFSLFTVLLLCKVSSIVITWLVNRELVTLLFFSL